MISAFHRYFDKEYGKYTDLDRSTPSELKKMIRSRSRKMQKNDKNTSHQSSSVSLLDEDNLLGF